MSTHTTMNTNTSADTIAIAGGTGTVGSILTRTLAAEGMKVRILTRDAERARAAFAHENVDYVAVDFDAPQTLRAALQGTGRAFLCMGTSSRQVHDEIALIDAAVAAGVPWLVNLSVAGAGRGIRNNVLEWHSEIDAHLRGTGIAHTSLQPTTYIDTIFRVAAGPISRGTGGGAAGKGRAAFIDVRDVAAVAAAVLRADAKAHAGQAYHLTGGAAVTMAQLAELVSAARGVPVHYAARSLAEQRAIHESAGLPPLAVDVLLGLDELTRDDLFAQPSSTVQDLTGAAARSPQAWVEERFGQPPMRTVTTAAPTPPRPSVTT